VDPGDARRIWRHIEVINAVSYFAPESHESARDVGLRGFWMGYFAFRAAPMGAVSPGVVDATFYNFHPERVRRSIPDAWEFAAPHEILAARERGAVRALRRLAPDVDDVAERVLPMLEGAVRQGHHSGRALFAANSQIEATGAVERLWQAATSLREHRGDGHVALLATSDLDGLEAHVLAAAVHGFPQQILMDTRGWSLSEWNDAVQRLADRGLVSAEGVKTEAGSDLATEIEHQTDLLACQPYQSLSKEELDVLLGQLRRASRAIVDAGEIPFPNPMGLRGSSNGPVA
jgi:hypothetical protein